jgi:MoxR-like ATPase
VLGAKARAAMHGRGVPNYDDVRAVAPSVLRHRVVTNFQAEADSRTNDSVVEELIQLSRKWTT